MAKAGMAGGVIDVRGTAGGDEVSRIVSSAVCEGAVVDACASGQRRAMVERQHIRMKSYSVTELGRAR